MKKAMLLVATVGVAMFALPAVASANVWHVQNGTIGFTGTGGTSQLTPASGSGVHCTSMTVTGGFETTTTGWIQFVTHGCTGPFGAACTTSGQPSGTIAHTKLTFHTGWWPLRRILVTPDNYHYGSFTCFGIPVKITGNGIIGTLNKNCGDKSNTATITFASTAAGVPDPSEMTGTSYGLETSTGGGAPVKASLDASATITFAGGSEQTFECT